MSTLLSPADLDLASLNDDDPDLVIAYADAQCTIVTGVYLADRGSDTTYPDPAITLIGVNLDDYGEYDGAYHENDHRPISQ